MRAALYDRPGKSHEVLRVTDIASPNPGPGEVRVRLWRSGVNPTDWKTRSGATGNPPKDFQIPGQDGAGEIDALGDGVDKERLGQRVWVWLAAKDRPWGTSAEWTVVPQHKAVPLPPGISFDFGASLGVPALTAHRCLFADGPLGGKSVLVAGGAGAVGHFAIQLAKHAGARVATTVSSDAKAELATLSGADLVVNYREPGVHKALMEFSATFDRIIEVALGSNLALDLALSGPGTTVVAYAAEPSDPTLPVRRCMNANVTIRFILLYGVPPQALDQAVADVSEALVQGALSELAYHHFPLDRVADAHDAVEAGAVGKVVLDIA